jgi:hypothetical protein
MDSVTLQALPAGNDVEMGGGSLYAHPRLPTTTGTDNPTATSRRFQSWSSPESSILRRLTLPSRDCSAPNSPWVSSRTPTRLPRRMNGRTSFTARKP